MDMILTPAYGRDYNSKDALLADYESGKDFILQPQGCYVNKQDLVGRVVKFRYDSNRKSFYL